MSVVQRKVEYFTDSGSQNTEKVIEAVENRGTSVFLYERE